MTDISTYVVPESSLSRLSKHQTNTFFKDMSISAEDCSRKAADILKENVRPTFVQGASSYTVEGGSKVVQFRLPRSPLSVEILALAQQTYGSFAPDCQPSPDEFHGLPVYVSDHVGGVTFAQARVDLFKPANYGLLERTVEEFGRLFGLAWVSWAQQRNRQPIDESATLPATAERLKRLNEAHPERFRPWLENDIERLEELYDDPGYPMVLNHSDFLEPNIHVDPRTGSMKGVVDWDGSKVGPFGLSLYGLETVLGVYSGRRGWVFHPGHESLRRVFWGCLEETAAGAFSDARRDKVGLARRVGLYHAFGFFAGGEVESEESSPNLEMLEAFLKC